MRAYAVRPARTKLDRSLASPTRAVLLERSVISHAQRRARLIPRVAPATLRVASRFLPWSTRFAEHFSAGALLVGAQPRRESTIAGVGRLIRRSGVHLPFTTLDDVHDALRD
jgi:hypothetical protein